MEGIHKLSSVIRRVIQWIAMTDLVTSAPVSKGNSPFLTSVSLKYVGCV